MGRQANASEFIGSYEFALSIEHAKLLERDCACKEAEQINKSIQN